MSAPRPGTRLTVRVDALLSDDLAVLMRSGMTASDAVRRAVEVVAEVHRNAWRMGVYPDGVAPVIEAAVLAPYDAGTGASDGV